MNNTISEVIDSPARKPSSNYTFIDSMRFVSMIGIVMEHASVFWNVKFITIQDRILQTISLQFFKFGTIVFFLVAGFLIGDKIKTYTPAQYMKRRLSTTVKPWLFWVAFIILLNYVDLLVKQLRNPDENLFANPVLQFFKQITDMVFYTSFWFIINFLIGMGILLVFRKYLNSLLFGVVLLLLSLFYALNLYQQYLATEHTIAVFGFIFYLWLGFQIHEHYGRFQQFVKKLPLWFLIFCSLGMLIISCTESMYLLNINPKDPYNTLRVTNVVYSVFCFLLLFKIGNLKWVDSIKPRVTTFGIYLIHYIIILHLLPHILRPMHLYDVKGFTAIQLFFMQLFRFFLAYGITYFLVRMIYKVPKIRWVIGQ